MARSEYMEYLSGVNTSSKSTYVIRNDENSVPGFWLFSDIDTSTTPHAITWTSAINQAYQFDHWKDAEETVRDLIFPRRAEVVEVSGGKYLP